MSSSRELWVFYDNKFIIISITSLSVINVVIMILPEHIDINILGYEDLVWTTIKNYILGFYILGYHVMVSINC